VGNGLHHPFTNPAQQESHSRQEMQAVKNSREGEEVDKSAFKALVRQAVALNGSGKSKLSKKTKS
jgi:hypothetical protein